MNRQIMSDPSYQAPVEGVVTKQAVAPDGALLTNIISLGIKGYNTYNSAKASSLKEEAQTKAWEAAQKLVDARRQGKLSAAEFQAAFQKVASKLTSQYGASYAGIITSTMANAKKFDPSLTKGTKFEQYYQEYKSMGLPDNIAKARAALQASSEMDAKLSENLNKTNPEYAARQNYIKSFHEWALNNGLDPSNPKTEELYHQLHMTATEVKAKQDKLKALTTQQQLNGIKVQQSIGEFSASLADLTSKVIDPVFLKLKSGQQPSPEELAVVSSNLEQTKASLIKAAESFKAKLVGKVDTDTLKGIDSAVEVQVNLLDGVEKAFREKDLKTAQEKKLQFDFISALNKSNPGLTALILTDKRVATPLFELVTNQNKTARDWGEKGLAQLEQWAAGINRLTKGREDPVVEYQSGGHSYPTQYLLKKVKEDPEEYNHLIHNLSQFAKEGDPEAIKSLLESQELFNTAASIDNSFLDNLDAYTSDIFTKYSEEIKGKKGVASIMYEDGKPVVVIKVTKKMRGIPHTYSYKIGADTPLSMALLAKQRELTFKGESFVDWFNKQFGKGE